MDELEFNDPDVPLADLVDGAPTTSAHPDALRAILARSNRSRIRTLAVALVAVAVAGPLAGYAVGHAGSSSTAVASASRSSAAQPNAPAPAASGASAAASGTLAAGSGGSTGAPPRQLFLRDTGDGIRIRAYLQDVPAMKIVSGCGIATGPPATAGSAGPATQAPTPAGKPAIAPAPAPCDLPLPAPTCSPSSLLEGQLSNDQVAGSSAAPVEPVPAGQVMDIVNADVVGTGDPTPIGAVSVHTTPAVAKVVLTFKGGGQDEMAPTADGYAILAHGVAGLAVASPTKVAPPTAGASGAPTVNIRSVGFGFPEATVTAFDKNGTQLASTTLPATVSLTGPGCGFSGGPAVEGSGGTVSSSGTGSASGGTVTSASTPAAKP